MNSKGNPILIEMAEQLPESAKIFKLIAEGESFSIIFKQAKEDFLCLEDLNKELKEGMSGLSLLKLNGYEKWFADIEEEEEEGDKEDDLLRMRGVLHMVVKFCEDLDDE